MRDGEPWFVAADVCRALSIANNRDALSKLDDDEKGVGLTDTLGGKQEILIISEPGLTTLILRCRDAVKPGTLPYRFRRWVTHEVLPSIRKTGSYGERAPIATRHLMLHGLPAPTVPLPDDIAEALEQKAWDMAREAYQLSVQHLRRRIAYEAEGGYPSRTLNRQAALAALEKGGLDYALTHLWHKKVEMLDFVINTHLSRVPLLAEHVRQMG